MDRPTYKQYIGARYVPKFFENSATGDSTWASGTEYEPLTIVTWNNNSYTSKKVVPSNVGAPNLNSEYWVQSGNFNAQYAELKAEVDGIEETVSGIQGDITSINGDIENIKGDITTLGNSVGSLEEDVDDAKADIVDARKNKISKVIFVGDSYSDPNRGVDTWVTYLTQYLGNPTVVANLSMGGAGFVGAGGATPWNTSLGNLANTMTQAEKDSVDSIIVAGGFNDRMVESETNMYIAIENFANVAKSQFKNAVVYLAFIGWCCDLDEPYQYWIITNPVIKCYRNCGRFGMRYLENCEYAMHDYDLFDHTESAVVHPNAEGGRAIADAMYGALTGNGSVFKPFVVNTMTNSQYVTARTGFNIRQMLDNNIVLISMYTENNSVAFQNVTIGTLKNGVPIATYNTGCYEFGGDSIRPHMQILAQTKINDNTYVDIPLYLYFAGKTVYVKCNDAVYASTGLLPDSTAVNQIWTSSANWVVPTIY